MGKYYKNILPDELFSEGFVKGKKAQGKRITLEHSKLKNLLKYQYNIDIDEIVEDLITELEKKKVYSLDIVSTVYNRIKCLLGEPWYLEFHSDNEPDSVFHERINQCEQLYFTTIYQIYLDYVDDLSYVPPRSRKGSQDIDKNKSLDVRTFEREYSKIGSAKEIDGEVFNIRSAHNKRRAAMEKHFSFVENFLNENQKKFSGIHYNFLGIVFSETYTYIPFKSIEKELNKRQEHMQDIHSEIGKELGIPYDDMDDNHECTADVSFDCILNYLVKVQGWFEYFSKREKNTKAILLTHLLIFESFIPIFTSVAFNNQLIKDTRNNNYLEDDYVYESLVCYSGAYDFMFHMTTVPNIFILFDLWLAFRHAISNDFLKAKESMSNCFNFLGKSYYPILSATFILTVESLIDKINYNFKADMAIKQLWDSVITNDCFVKNIYDAAFQHSPVEHAPKNVVDEKKEDNDKGNIDNAAEEEKDEVVTEIMNGVIREEYMTPDYRVRNNILDIYALSSYDDKSDIKACISLLRDTAIKMPPYFDTMK